MEALSANFERYMLLIRSGDDGDDTLTEMDWLWDKGMTSEERAAARTALTSALDITSVIQSNDKGETK